jgi:hypothetical protein
MRMQYKATDILDDGGVAVRQIVLDHRDAAQVGKIIQRERKRAGSTMLSPMALKVEVDKALSNTGILQNPRLRSQIPG